MKRLRFIILVSAVAAAMAVPVVAKATGSTGTTNSVTIQEHADYDFVGATIDVGLRVRCTGGSGDVIVNLQQFPPETPYPVSAGSGTQIVVCDGQTHTVAVTLAPALGFDAGRAWATADLTTFTGGEAHAERWVTIIVV
jgi:hypothetical protein